MPENEGIQEGIQSGVKNHPENLTFQGKIGEKLVEVAGVEPAY
jgi:hypothetical protein